MTIVTVTLPDSLFQFVEEQAAQRGFDTPGDYVSRLIHDELNRVERERADSLLRESLASREPIPADEQYWEGKRSEPRDRLERSPEARRER